MHKLMKKTIRYVRTDVRTDSNYRKATLPKIADYFTLFHSVFCLSVLFNLSVCLSVLIMSVHIVSSAYPSANAMFMSICLSVCQSVLSVYLFFFMSLYLVVCPYVFI